MSYSQRPVSKMHCKVCESAKKSPSVVASHFPKNRDGKTVCPTLLAQHCRGCGVKGHTISYCPANVEVKLVLKKEYKPTPIAKSKETKTAYDSLYVSDDEDEEDEKEVVVQVVRVVQVIVSKDATKSKEKKTGPVKKFCWATAESDSSGSDEEEEEE